MYIPHWLKAPLAAHAPANYLTFCKTIKHYSVVDKEISQVALKAAGNHGWYLTEYLIPLVLWDRKLTANINQEVAHCLAQHLDGYSGPENRINYYPEQLKCGKSVMPNVGFTSEYTDFVGSSSPIFFKCLHIDPSFLHKRQSEWCLDDAYLDGKKKIDSLHVVNDLAERGVKVAADYSTSAKIEVRFQNIVQRVQGSRKNYPNLRLPKAKAAKELDILKS